MYNQASVTFDPQIQDYVDQQLNIQRAQYQVADAKKGLLHSGLTTGASLLLGVAGFATGNILAEHAALAGVAAGVYEGGKSLHEWQEGRKTLKELEDTSQVTYIVEHP